ncbi:ABC transporter ATP-binding protein [Corynebacterium guangdongense]|uniref:ABC transport system ATP-binding protein n=1 Tax=Corynebacterium guangdongense TaxID=1783348 RepID=A0ABU1ZV72_9CORY|nr:ABC transporter ATP-binding protein [Corynebacterium guangdongense]MDR7328817.1 putative ABC transport system ATP-binding protein [Corynebacterium guangdongense]WJZ17392.1 ABC transporter ATP-binding protein YxdL [Corynebacterium guangdongense]
MSARLPLQLEGVTCVFGVGARQVTALDGVSLALRPGELVAVMGPSGSGKSTLLNVAGLLQRPSSGRVLVDGRSASGFSRAAAAELRRRHIGIVFQRFNLIDTLTVAENVALPLELDGASRVQCRAAAARALAEVGLDGVGERFPEEISGGQAQRVAIARALVGERRLLLADEPTGALDTTTGDEILRLLRSRVDAGASALLVTHEPRFAGWADRVVFVRDGRLTGEEESRR